MEWKGSKPPLPNKFPLPFIRQEVGGFPMLCTIFLAKSEQAILVKFRHQYNLKLLRSQTPLMGLDLILWTFWGKCIHFSSKKKLYPNSTRDFTRNHHPKNQPLFFTHPKHECKDLRKFRKKDQDSETIQ